MNTAKANIAGGELLNQEDDLLRNGGRQQRSDHGVILSLLILMFVVKCSPRTLWSRRGMTKPCAFLDDKEKRAKSTWVKHTRQRTLLQDLSYLWRQCERSTSQRFFVSLLSYQDEKVICCGHPCLLWATPVLLIFGFKFYDWHAGFST